MENEKKKINIVIIFLIFYKNGIKIFLKQIINKCPKNTRQQNPIYKIKVRFRLQTLWLRHVILPNCKNFNKFLDFKNRYIHNFLINMTNQVMKESNISFTIITIVSI